MNTVIVVLILITVIITVLIIAFILLSIKAKAYLKYRQKLLSFEEKKKRIEADIEKDRKEFRDGS